MFKRVWSSGFISSDAHDKEYARFEAEMARKMAAMQPKSDK
jgi:hypothetical protein